MTLSLPFPDVRALVTGETIVAFVAHGTVAAGATVAIEGTGPRDPSDLKPAYRRWAGDGIPAGRVEATVDAAMPAARLDPEDGASRHILAAAGAGDLVVLRVSRNGIAVLSDDAYSARRNSLDAALRA